MGVFNLTRVFNLTGAFGLIGIFNTKGVFRLIAKGFIIGFNLY